MKIENLKRAVQINTEYEQICSKLKELNHLESNLKEPTLTVDLRVDGVLTVANVNSVFTQGEILLLCNEARSRLRRRKQKLEQELENL